MNERLYDKLQLKALRFPGKPFERVPLEWFQQHEPQLTLANYKHMLQPKEYQYLELWAAAHLLRLSITEQMDEDRERYQGFVHYEALKDRHFYNKESYEETLRNIGKDPEDLWNHYILYMSQDGVWGDNTELKAVANYLDRPIYFFEKGKNKHRLDKVYNSNSLKEPLHLYFHINHYTAVELTGQPLNLSPLKAALKELGEAMTVLSLPVAGENL
jgi:hypothetical protein